MLCYLKKTLFLALSSVKDLRLHFPFIVLSFPLEPPTINRWQSFLEAQLFPTVTPRNASNSTRVYSQFAQSSNPSQPNTSSFITHPTTWLKRCANGFTSICSHHPIHAPFRPRVAACVGRRVVVFSAQRRKSR